MRRERVAGFLRHLAARVGNKVKVGRGRRIDGKWQA